MSDKELDDYIDGIVDEISEEEDYSDNKLAKSTIREMLIDIMYKEAVADELLEDDDEMEE